MIVDEDIQPEYLRAKEAATLMGVAICTIWAYRKSGKITGYKLSDKVTVFKLSELRAFIESNKVEVA